MFVIPFPTIDPVLIQVGPFAIRWYALAYIAGIFFGWWYAKRLIADARLWGRAGAPMKPATISWAFSGVYTGRLRAWSLPSTRIIGEALAMICKSEALCSMVCDSSQVNS